MIKNFFQKGFTSCKQHPFFHNQHPFFNRFQKKCFSSFKQGEEPHYHYYHYKRRCGGFFKWLLIGGAAYGLYRYSQKDHHCGYENSKGGYKHFGHGSPESRQKVDNLIAGFKNDLQKVIDEKGPGSEEAARINQTLGLTLLSLHYYEEGLYYLDKAMNSVKKIAAGDSTPSFSNNLQDTELQKSLGVLSDTLDLLRRTYGENSKEVALCLNNIGATHLRLNNSTKAAEYLQQAYPILTRTDGDEGNETLSCLYNLSEAHKKNGEKFAAMKVLEDLVKKSSIKFGETHPQTLKYKQELDGFKTNH